MITSRSILCSMDGFIQSKQVDEAVSFHDTLKMLKLKTNASDGVIKKKKEFSCSFIMSSYTCNIL